MLQDATTQLQCKSVILIHSFCYFYSASSSPLLLRGAPDYQSQHAEAHRLNYLWRTCLESICGGQSGIQTCDPPDARHPPLSHTPLYYAAPKAIHSGSVSHVFDRFI